MKVLVIGACNVDVVAKSIEKVKLYNSNPSNISICFGGVGKNIASNLALLGVDVSMFTALSNDALGGQIKANLNDLGIKLDKAIYCDDRSSMYLCMNDVNGDLVVGAADTDIANKINKERIIENIEYINSFDYVVIDTNLSTEAIDTIINNVNKPIIVDTVSTSKARKLKEFKNIYCVKANTFESAAITNIEINNDEDLLENARYFYRKGAKNVCITLGKDGVFFYDGSNSIKLPTLKTNVINTSGAGDSFLAGLVYGFINKFDINKLLNTALKVAKITIECDQTVNPSLSKEKIQ